MADEMGWRERANVLAWLLETGKVNYANDIKDVLPHCEYDASSDHISIKHPRFHAYIKCKTGQECIRSFQRNGFSDNPASIRP